MSDMPHSIEAEQALLGCVLVNNDVFAGVRQHCGPEHFYDPVHARIFEAAAGLIANERLASPVTLKPMMQDDEGVSALGGASYLVRLADSAIAISQAAEYAQIVRDQAERRELIEAARELEDRARDQSVNSGTISDEFEMRLASRDQSNVKAVVSLLAATIESVKIAVDAYQNAASQGVPSGIGELDAMTGGFRPGEMIILGGRPSMGKSAIALSMASAAARSGKGVVIASLEMVEESLANRLIAEQTALMGRGVQYSKALRGEIQESQMEAYVRAAEVVGNLPIYIITSSVRDVSAVHAAVKRSAHRMAQRGTELGIVFIDYLQLLRSPKANRFEQMTEVSIAIKELAMRLRVPVVALAQLSRQVEQRENKRPQLSDLRESGQIEQDADAVMFCFREEYYLERENPDFTGKDGRINLEKQQAYEGACASVRNRLELIVAKQRNGPVGTINLGFNPALNTVWSVR